MFRFRIVYYLMHEYLITFFGTEHTHLDNCTFPITQLEEPVLVGTYHYHRNVLFYIANICMEEAFGVEFGQTERRPRFCGMKSGRSR